MKEYTSNHLEPKGHIHIIFLNTPISEMKKLMRRGCCTDGRRLGHPAGVVALPREWGHTALVPLQECLSHRDRPRTCGTWSFHIVLRHSEFANIIKHRTKCWRSSKNLGRDLHTCTETPPSPVIYFPSVWFFLSWCLSDNRSNVNLEVLPVSAQDFCSNYPSEIF